jgi:hypothetical protein
MLHFRFTRRQTTRGALEHRCSHLPQGIVGRTIMSGLNPDLIGAYANAK